MNRPAFATPALPFRASSLRATRTRRPTMVAAAAPPSEELSYRASQLLSYVRAHKSIFSPGLGFTASHLALFRKNDTARCMVPAEELECNAALLPGVSVASAMADVSETAFEDARKAVAAAQADMGEKVTAIIEHDLKYFARVVSYAVACGSDDFIHQNNMGMVRELYAEIGLETKAVLAGVESLRVSTMACASGAKEEKIVADVFVKLIEALSA